MKEPQTLTARPFTYLRHCETDWNRENRQQGHADIPLNDFGRAQARGAGAALDGCDIATICCSPLARARATADIVNRQLGCPIVAIGDLIKYELGVGEGRVPGQWYLDWRAGAALDGAENFAAFIARALGGVNQALAHPGPVLIVGHGGVYRTVKIHAGLDLGFRLENCVQIHHRPPGGGGGGWTARAL